MLLNATNQSLIWFRARHQALYGSKSGADWCHVFPPDLTELLPLLKSGRISQIKNQEATEHRAWYIWDMYTRGRGMMWRHGDMIYGVHTRVGVRIR